MKCSHLIFSTLASTVMLSVGCNKGAETKPVEKPAAPAAAPAAAVTAPAVPTDPNEVVASVNGVKYIRKDMETVVNALLKSQPIPPEQMDAARKHFEQRAAYSFIMKTLLLAEAKKLAVTVTDEDRQKQLDKMGTALKPQNKTVEQFFKESPLGEKEARAEFEDGLIIDKLIQKTTFDGIKIGADEVSKVIAEATEKNKQAETSKPAKKTKIEDLKKQLAAGADFAELAKKNSDCPSSQKGGDLGEFTRGQMVKAFEDAAFTQEIGKVGDVVETQFGYHLIKVTAKSPAAEAKGDTPAKPESVTASHILIKLDPSEPVPTAEQVETQLKQVKSRDAVQKYIEGLKAAAKIETIFKDIQL